MSKEALGMIETRGLAMLALLRPLLRPVPLPLPLWASWLQLMLSPVPMRMWRRSCPNFKFRSIPK